MFVQTKLTNKSKQWEIRISVASKHDILFILTEQLSQHLGLRFYQIFDILPADAIAFQFLNIIFLIKSTENRDRKNPRAFSPPHLYVYF